MTKDMPLQAIFKTRYTEAATFAGIPSKETRDALRKHGFEYRDGNWVRTVSKSDVVTEEQVAQQIAA